VAHLASGDAAGLAVEVDVRAAHTQGVLQSQRHARTIGGGQQVDHRGGGRAQCGRTQRPAEHGADVVLKLRADARLDAVVTGVVNARRKFVDEELAVLEQKHFHAETADRADGFDGAAGKFGGAFGDLRRDRRGHADDMADVAALHGFDDGIGNGFTVAGACDDDGQFFGERTELLGKERVAGLAAQSVPGQCDVGERAHGGVALAVVGVAAGFEQERPSPLTGQRRHVLDPLHRAHPGHGQPGIGECLLLDEFVLNRRRVAADGQSVCPRSSSTASAPASTNSFSSVTTSANDASSSSEFGSFQSPMSVQAATLSAGNSGCRSRITTLQPS
jgi:hypothetical protein